MRFPSPNRSQIFACALGVLTVSAVFACGDDATPKSNFDPNAGKKDDAGEDNGSSGTLPNGGADGGGDDDDGSAPPIGTLQAIIRDFKKYDGTSATNPDFENVPSDNNRPDGTSAGYAGPWSEATSTYYPDASYPIDIVLPALGADNTPQYNVGASFKGTPGRTATTHGKTFFDQWYHDTAGMNVQRKVLITLTNNNGVYSYDSAVSGIPLASDNPTKEFFPIDNDGPASTSADGFGNQGDPHNYSFTVELHTKFKYRGSEHFKFSGDDDVFVFINKQLVINIGGIHGALSKDVSLPDVASALGLVVGQEYQLDFFQAERHVVESNLRIDTTLELQAGGVK